MTTDDEPYENTLSLEELRREVRRLWDREHALTKALRELPEVPHWRALYLLSSAAKWPDDNNVGKRMQRDHGFDAIAPRSEAEGGAGLWSHIRAGVLAARSPKPDLRWTVGDESPGYHPTMPSAVAAFQAAFGRDTPLHRAHALLNPKEGSASE